MYDTYFVLFYYTYNQLNNYNLFQNIFYTYSLFFAYYSSQLNQHR